MKLKIAELNEQQLKDYLVAACRIKELTPDKLTLVLNKYKKSAGESSAEIQRMLIEAHLKLVVCIANRYRGAGISFANLIGHGNGALISAVKKWDGTDGADFLPYLAWSIEGAILDALIRAKKEAGELK
jgi:DNA-directed RNA polymerase sigma subunit (sigma70/sigma32)